MKKYYNRFFCPDIELGEECNYEYLPGKSSLVILSADLALAVYSGFYCNALMIPNRQEKDFLFATIASAVINVILNLIIIPFYGMQGAAITTLISEMIVITVAIRKTRNNFKLKVKGRNFASVLLGSALIAVICVSCKKIFVNWAIELLTAILCSGLVYFGTLILLKNDLIKMLLSDFCKKITKK